MGEEAFLLIMGAVIGFGSSFAQSIFTSKQLKNERREERIAELNRELATALATARAVLADAYPGSLTDHDSSGLSHQGLQDNKDKWQPARVALLIASDRHPDDEVRRLTHRLTVAVDGMLTKCGNMIGAVGAGSSDAGEPFAGVFLARFQEARRLAQAQYEEAASIANDLAVCVRLRTER